MSDRRGTAARRLCAVGGSREAATKYRIARRPSRHQTPLTDMISTRLSAALGFLLALGSTACGGSERTSEGLDASDALKSQSGAYLVRYTPIPDPPVTGKNQLTLDLARATGGAVADATLEVTPWMPAMGHGSPVQPTVQDLGGGEYSVDDLDYTMPGRWEVKIALTDADVVDQVVIELDVR